LALEKKAAVTSGLPITHSF